MVLARVLLGMTGGAGGAYFIRENEALISVLIKQVQGFNFSKPIPVLRTTSEVRPNSPTQPRNYLEWAKWSTIGFTVLGIYYYFPNLYDYAYVTRKTFLKGMITVKDSVTVLSNHIYDLKSRILGITKQISDVDKNLEQLKDRSEHKFEEIVSNMEHINNRLTRVDQNLSCVNKSVNHIDSKLDSVDFKINDIHKQVVNSTDSVSDKKREDKVKQINRSVSPEMADNYSIRKRLKSMVDNQSTVSSFLVPLLEKSY